MNDPDILHAALYIAAQEAVGDDPGHQRAMVWDWLQRGREAVALKLGLIDPGG